MLLVAVFAVWASAIDAKQRRLPNKLLAAMFTSACACLTLRTLGSPWLAAFPWLDALDCHLPRPSACVYLAIVLTIALFLVESICRALTHKAGIGFGDVKLLACWTLALGTWSILAFTCACATGAIWGLANCEKAFPLGPFITGWSLVLALGLVFLT